VGPDGRFFAYWAIFCLLGYLFAYWAIFLRMAGLFMDKFLKITVGAQICWLLLSTEKVTY
jgi:hypothetical protein